MKVVGAVFLGGRRWRVAVACAVCAGVLAMACAARAQSEEQNVQKILMLLRLDEYGRSLESVNQMLQATPHDCRLLSLRGIALNGLGKQAEALKSFQTALRYCPENPLALEGAAEIEYARRRPDAATLLLRILKQRPKDVTAHAMLASWYRETGHCQEALPQFEASRPVFAAQPKFQQAYAFCLAETGHWKQAAANYKAILGSDRDEAARYNLALVQWKMHDAKAGLKTLGPLLGKSHRGAVLALGARLAEETGDTARAKKLERELAAMRKGNGVRQTAGQGFVLENELAHPAVGQGQSKTRK